jgi:cobalt-zinc-cadmium efflux system outer membrane protein
MKSVPSTTDSRFLRERSPAGLLRLVMVLAGMPIVTLPAQTALTWQQVKDKFESANPTLKAAQLNIDESRAAEITAYLRPNPDFTLSADGTQLTPYEGIYRPFAGTQISPAISYLHERQHKRELRRDQAKESTAVTESTYLDQERGLVFTLRGAFVQTLQAKAVLENAQQNLASRPAIWPKWIWTGWNCSGCSLNPTTKRRSSICGPPRSSF